MNRFTFRFRRHLLMITLGVFLAHWLGGLPALTHAEDAAPETITTNSCFLRVYESADIPALERGAITQTHYEIGDLVDAGVVLAQLDETESAIDLSIAKLELDIASMQLDKSLAVEIAKSRLVETQRLIDQSKVKQQIAENKAVSSVEVETAIKARDTALLELNRAIAARKGFSGSVSDSELDHLKYAKEKSELDIVGAQEAREVAALEVKIEKAAVETAAAAVKRLEYELSQSESDREVEKLKLEQLSRQIELAEQRCLRRKIQAPFAGMLIEQYRHRGEWLEPGQPIFRILRLDRLVVEGFADANLVHHSMRGADVKVISHSSGTPKSYFGKLSFVSPEIDPVNQQVQIRALIDNPSGELRAGEPVELIIETP